MLPHPKSKVALSVRARGISKGRASRLLRINDWPVRAEQAEYNVNTLANNCQVSARQLQRFFKAAGRPTPKQWIRRLRMTRALELLREGLAIKEVAARLDFHDTAHFSKRFSETFGVPPTLFHLVSDQGSEASFAE